MQEEYNVQMVILNSGIFEQLKQHSFHNFIFFLFMKLGAGALKMVNWLFI